MTQRPPHSVDVLVRRLDPDVPLPSYAHPGDAGVDLVTTVRAEVAPGERVLLPTGIAIALPDGTERVVEGTIEGTIIREPRGTNGFGYDPVFVPLGYQVTTAEMPSQEKDAISHRGRALQALAPVVRELLGE